MLCDETTEHAFAQQQSNRKTKERSFRRTHKSEIFVSQLKIPAYG